jgi:rhamnosyltransferase
MITDKVCAVIVSFHPPAELIGSICKLRPQVQGLIIVDNASRDSELQPLHASRQRLDFEIIQNSRNLGIAAALNVGVRWAVDHGFNWVALFDQDSTVTEGYIRAMLRAHCAHPRPGAIGILGPAYEDPYTCDRAGPRLLAEDGGPVEVMTSGSMIPASVFSECGLFREDFVIDEVDHEFCFRVRDHNFIVVQCDAAVLLHQPGSPKRLSVLGITLIHATQHKAKRRYYVARNGVVLVRRYWRKYPKWAYQTLRDLGDAVLAILLVEDDKYNKVRNTLLGLKDGMQSKMGQVIEL